MNPPPQKIFGDKTELNLELEINFELELNLEPSPAKKLRGTGFEQYNK